MILPLIEMGNVWMTNFGGWKKKNLLKVSTGYRTEVCLFFTTKNKQVKLSVQIKLDTKYANRSINICN